jgi:carboxyl-terminal processing protease
MTVAQFFRINGGTTQLRGVKPDILFPAVSDAENFGESSFDNALPWAQIKAADYSPTGDLKGLLPILVTLHEARVKMDKDFQYLQEDIAEFKLQRKKNLVSLNEAERRKERDAQEARLKSRESRRDTGNSAHEDVVGKEPAPGKGSALRDDGLQADERNLANELAAEKVRKNGKDVLLNEAVHILSDEVVVLKTGARLAARVKPGSLLMPD